MQTPLFTAMNTGDWVDAALHAVQLAAIVVAAAWAYYKFVRGRVFHRRAEVTLEASLLELASSHAIRIKAIRIKATLKNTGSADIPLLVNALKVFSFRNGDVDDEGHQQWRKFVTLPVFENHGWIESRSPSRLNRTADGYRWKGGQTVPAYQENVDDDEIRRLKEETENVRQDTQIKTRLTS